MHNNFKLKIASLFSGIGGFESGLKSTDIDYEIVFASEIDSFARKSYSANFDSKVMHGDITKVSESEIPSHDMLVAGFPCQTFSIAGRREGFLDTRGTLFFDIERILKEKRPKYVLLENVKNLVSHDHSNTIRVILKTLSEIGYTTDFTIINSLESGVPQNRDRTYIFSVLKGDIEKFHTDNRNKKIDKLKMELNNEKYSGFNFFNNLSFKNQSRVILDILQDKVQDKYVLKNDELYNFINSNDINYAKEKSNKIIKLFDIPKEIHNDMERQRRVYSPYGISPTVLARSDSTKILIKEINDYKIRKITPEENFYVQGFDREFVKNIRESGMSDTQMYKQSGNAVSPPVIKGIMDLFKDNYLNDGPKFIDLFSGLGGFRIAFENLGAECVFSSEIDKHARETYYNNFGEYPAGDITKINEKDIPDHDILCAGFPCQPFSIAGKRKGFEDTRGTLFFDILRILEEKKPKGFLLENVAGLTSHDGGKTIKVISDTLNQAGYDFVFSKINAKDLGIPQNRNRWYGVGVRKDLNENKDINLFQFPQQKPFEFTLHDIIEPKVDSQYNVTETAEFNINNHLDSHLESNRYKEGNVLIANEIRKSKCNFRSDGISPCLTAKMGTGGNNIPVYVSEMRKLTEKECLRLMGFPKGYQIKENSYQSYKQIGNSVVVPVIEEIGRELLQFIYS